MRGVRIWNWSSICSHKLRSQIDFLGEIEEKQQQVGNKHHKRPTMTKKYLSKKTMNEKDVQDGHQYQHQHQHHNHHHHHRQRNRHPTSNGSKSTSKCRTQQQSDSQDASRTRRTGTIRRQLQRNSSNKSRSGSRTLCRMESRTGVSKTKLTKQQIAASSPTNSESSLVSVNRLIKKHKRRNVKLPDVQKDLSQECKIVEQERLMNQEKINEQMIMNNPSILAKGFKIEKLIGSGSYAHVYRALDMKTNQYVAVKLIELEKCSSHYRKHFLKHEVEIIRRLKNFHHPNIIILIQAFNVDMPKGYVMVMEFVDGGTLNDRICEKGALAESAAKRMFYGMCCGLNLMHDNNIAHRDMKLDNILLTHPDMVPKICDFSLSINWDETKDPLCMDFCGTPPFFAPEIYQKIPYNPMRYDVWSTGVCLYIMTNNTLPFYHENDQIILRRQLNRVFKFRRSYNLSTELKQLIKDMLEPDFQRRITIKGVLQSNWLQSITSSSSNK